MNGVNENFFVVDLVDDLPGVISSFIIRISEREVVVIDPGPSSGYKKLREWLDLRGFRVKYVIATHVHIDHAGSAGLLAKDYPVEKVFVHPRGSRHLISPEKLWNASRGVLGEVAELYGKPEPVPEEKVFTPQDGEEITLGHERFKFIYTPGHASHHMSILLLDEKVMFTGDSAGVILDVNNKIIQAPTTPPIFKPKLYLESLDKMINSIPKPLYIAPTHFGLRKPFDALIQKHKDQTLLWLETVSRAIKEGVDDVNKIMEFLAEKDSDVKILMQYGSNFLKREFIVSSLLGIIDAIKRGEWN